MLLPCNNVIIVGDFNANPFEEVCINANCFHAVSSKDIAKKRKKRIIKGQEYAIFYNPMWNLFGDKNQTNGTYYYDKEGITAYFWNIFDQVILSPEVAEIFEDNSLKIISSINNNSLLYNNGIPNKDDISDHLPIFFQIREEFL